MLLSIRVDGVRLGDAPWPEDVRRRRHNSRQPLHDVPRTKSRLAPAPASEKDQSSIGTTRHLGVRTPVDV